MMQRACYSQLVISQMMQRACYSQLVISQMMQRACYSQLVIFDAASSKYKQCGVFVYEIFKAIIPTEIPFIQIKIFFLFSISMPCIKPSNWLAAFLCSIIWCWPVDIGFFFLLSFSSLSGRTSSRCFLFQSRRILLQYPVIHIYIVTVSLSISGNFTPRFGYVALFGCLLRAWKFKRIIDGSDWRTCYLLT